MKTYLILVYGKTKSNKEVHGTAVYTESNPVVVVKQLKLDSLRFIIDEETKKSSRQAFMGEVAKPQDKLLNVPFSVCLKDIEELQKATKLEAIKLNEKVSSAAGYFDALKEENIKLQAEISQLRSEVARLTTK